jgi:pilus assembly protein CpaB
MTLRLGGGVRTRLEAMSIRTLASFAIAIFLGLVAVLMVRSYIGAGRQASGLHPAGGTTPVVVAASPIARGADVQANMLKVADYPRDSVPVGAYQAVAQITGVTGAKHLALRAIAVNEPVLPNRISGAGAKTNLSGSLTPGMRAVSIRSNDVTGVAGFVLPGDRVDVMATRAVGNGNDATSLTQVLAENVRVLGVDQSDDDEANKPVVAKAVTVEVSPDQAQSISLAQSIGNITLSLRQLSDDAALERRSTTVADLGGPTKRSVKAAPTPLADPGARQAQPRARAKVAHIASKSAEIHVVRGVEVSGYPVDTH